MAVSYDRDHWRLTFGGMSAGSEIWQCGLNIASSLANDIDWPGAGLDLPTIHGRILTAWNASQVSSGAAFDWTRLALINKAGKYKHDALDYNGTRTTGNVLTTQSGPQDSVCVSFWSGSSIGTANYGRIYLPWSGATVERPGGHLAPASCNAIVAAWKTCIVAVVGDLQQQTGGATLRLFNMSTVGASKEVRYVNVGDVLDTQRRRRNAMRETYYQQTLYP